MTRWKKQNPDSLILMHAHNRWSMFYTYVLHAAADLDIPVCEREYANHWDGSTDREWIAPAGTKARIYALAYERQAESWARRDAEDLR